MTELLVLFGVLIVVLGLVIIIRPETIFGYLQGHYDNLSIQILAVVVRLIIGVLLISQSGFSKFPLTIEILGWLSVVAALSFALMGRQNFLKLMSWAMGLFTPYGRVGGIFATLFGGFLVYAFV
ncbi:MAG: hypothetical protein ACR2PS_10145 [Pseudomonadales bacterium]